MPTALRASELLCRCQGMRASHRGWMWKELTPWESPEHKAIQLHSGSREMNVAVQLAVSFLFSLGHKFMEWCKPTPLNLSGNTLNRHTQRWVSMVILNPLKLTRTTVTLTKFPLQKNGVCTVYFCTAGPRGRFSVFSSIGNFTSCNLKTGRLGSKGERMQDWMQGQGEIGKGTWDGRGR